MSDDLPVMERWTHDPWDDPDRTGVIPVEDMRANRRGLRWAVYGVGIFVTLAIIAAGVVGLWYVRRVDPPGDAGAAVNFTVNKGDTLDKVAARLKADGLISSESLFTWYVDHHGGLTLTEGYYRIRKSDHMGNIMLVLGTPPSETFTKITFPEGFTMAKMAARLQKNMPRLTASAFEAAAGSNALRSKFQPLDVTSLEGLLFPDTYQVSNIETVTMLMRRMVAQLDRVGGQEKLEEKAAQLGYSPYQVLIVASMIEREAKTAVDRPLVARVIYNRLFLGMNLDIDATLYYNQPPDTPFPVLKATDSPYNTYLHPGLPPTPIANPGRDAIHAALNPAPPLTENDPLCKDLPAGEVCALKYYVLSDVVGNHKFAVTLAQHDKNVEEARNQGLLD